MCVLEIAFNNRTIYDNISQIFHDHFILVVQTLMQFFFSHKHTESSVLLLLCGSSSSSDSSSNSSCQKIECSNLLHSIYRQ